MSSNLLTASQSLLARLHDRLAERRRYRAALAELEQLSDTELDDLNVARCDLPAIARAEARCRR